jgi:hypothetical protein
MTFSTSSGLPKKNAVFFANASDTRPGVVIAYQKANTAPSRSA